jgi:inositol monophosphatase 3
MMVANGEVDAMVYCQSWTHKWDSCAGEAIIKAMGGRFTTPWGSNIVYNTDRTETHNKQGMIAALDR